MIASRKNVFCLPVLAWLLFAAAFVAVQPVRAADGDAKSEAEMKPYKEKLGKHLEFVPIPAGKFKLGSPDKEPGRLPDEGPQVDVAVEAFWMGKFEITADDFALFRDEYDKAKKQDIPADKLVDAVSIPTPIWEQDARPILNGLGEKNGYPASDMSQYAAMQFTKWLSKKTGRFYRLPTEAEWEYAAKAGTTTAYSWGDDAGKIGEYAWFFDNTLYENPDKGYPRTDRDHYTPGAGYRQVGKLKPNPWGLYDMHGNVAEWVLDAYDKDYYKSLAGKQVNALDIINWPKSTFPTVYRGGSWAGKPEVCRSSSRENSVDAKKMQELDPQKPKSPWWYTDAFHIGIRVVRPLKEPAEADKYKYWDTKLQEILEVIEKSNASDKQFKKLITP